MGLPWIRLDTSMPDNPKLLGLLSEKDGHRAAFVWVCCMAYAGKHGTDGFIPREAVARVNGRNADMGRLVTANLLDVTPGGWLIKSWNEFQITDAEAQKRREKAQRAASIRWSKDEAAKAQKEAS
jgi:hypothetical protein